MEDTTLAASALLHDQIHQNDQWKFQHCTDGGMTHSEAEQHELIRVEPSESLHQPRARGCKDKLSEAQKREKKRESDVKYRLKKKRKVNEMTDQNKSLQSEIGQLSTENRHLKEETGRLTAENRHLAEHIKQVESKGKLLAVEGNDVSQSMSLVDHQSVYIQNKCLQEEIERLSTENRHLKDETGRLTIENRHLEEHIRELQSTGKLPAEVLHRQDSYVSQSTSQYKRENVQILTSLNITTQHYLNTEAENSVLRAQIMELSQRLVSLNKIITFFSESNNDAFDAEDISYPFNLAYLNQPVFSSITVFQC